MSVRLTPNQRRVLDFIFAEGKVNCRQVAGEFGMRSQDAGRTLISLERKGLVRPDYDGGRFGYVAR